MVYNHFLRGARNIGGRISGFATKNVARVFSSAHNHARQFGALANQGSAYANHINNNMLGGALNNNPVYENGMKLLTTVGNMA